MPDTSSRRLRVFLCHSSGDKPAVRDLYRKLEAEEWIDAWLDEEKLFPGMDWNLEIEKAVEAADAILVCLSNDSITKEGYVQRELRIVLDFADYKPEGTLYVIPVRLEPCEPPRRLRGWQYADYFPKSDRDRAYRRLLVSLRNRATALGIFTEKMKKRAAPPRPRARQASVGGNAQPARRKRSTKITTSSDHRTFYMVGKIEFVEVPKGRFLMGSMESDKNASPGEQPQHPVDIPHNYYISRFPVTNEQYAMYVEAIKGMIHPVKGWEKKHDHPVVNVSWMDAMAYCEWLTNSQRHVLPSGQVLRLPTEAEWEKAARGMKGMLYPWGNLFDKNSCNSKAGGKEGTTPVGAYSPQGDSPYGCVDMVGNVWEWTHSLYSDYPYVSSDGREEENTAGRGKDEDSSNRVLRGGAFDSDQREARAAYRFAFLQEAQMETCGFRVVLAPELWFPILTRIKNMLTNP